MAYSKEQTKSPETDPKEKQDQNFKISALNMLNEIRKAICKQSDIMNKMIEIIKKNKMKFWSLQTQKLNRTLCQRGLTDKSKNQ